ncbi:MAG: PEP/pyruvate-binding domain-containing protein [Thermomicrobiales bacterium]
MTKKWTYGFDEGSASQVELLGGKGANLCEMTSIGLPVPPGFVISTDVSRVFMDKGELPDDLWDEVHARVEELEESLDQKFGSPTKPLLVSVRLALPYRCPE